MSKLIVAAAKINVIWLLLFLGACSPASVTMDSTFQDFSTRIPSEKTCNLVVESLEDHRRDKKSLGVLAYTEVFSVDPLLWVENGLKSFGVLRIPAEDILDNRYSMKVSLKVAHIRSLLSAKTANTVLGLSQDDFETVRYFRGSHASVNWNSSPGEIKKAFDISLAMAIQSMVESMADGCDAVIE